MTGPKTAILVCALVATAMSVFAPTDAEAFRCSRAKTQSATGTGTANSVGSIHGLAYAKLQQTATKRAEKSWESNIRRRFGPAYDDWRKAGRKRVSCRRQSGAKTVIICKAVGSICLAQTEQTKPKRKAKCPPRDFKCIARSLKTKRSPEPNPVLKSRPVPRANPLVRRRH